MVFTEAGVRLIQESYVDFHGTYILGSPERLCWERLLNLFLLFGGFCLVCFVVLFLLFVFLYIFVFFYFEFTANVLNPGVAVDRVV